MSYNKGWLLFFYSVPAKPVAGRIKVWRRLTKAGAIQFKGSVYILPDNEEHYELFQWLVSEAEALKGDAAFVRVPKVETMKDEEVISLFRRQRAKDYLDAGKTLDELERRVPVIVSAPAGRGGAKLKAQFNRCLKGFEEVRKIDFFKTREGDELAERMRAVKGMIAGLSGDGMAGAGARDETPPRRIEDYQGKTWVTRKRPFIDRMASAWLIKRFIDPESVFGFVEENGMDNLDRGAVTFDMRGGEFTHVGELCTFEVMVKSFGLKDRALKVMAEIVHELDVKDERYRHPEASGVEGILSGIRKTAKDDAEALEKGMAVFEMLYASKR